MRYIFRRKEGENSFLWTSKKAIFFSTLAFEKGNFKTFCKQCVWIQSIANLWEFAVRSNTNKFYLEINVKQTRLYFGFWWNMNIREKFRHAVVVALFLDVLSKEVMSWTLLTPITDNDWGASDYFTFIAFGIEFAKTSIFAQLHVIWHCQKRDLMLGTQSLDQFLVRGFVTVFSQNTQ